VGCNRAVTNRRMVVGGMSGSLCCGSPVGCGALAIRPTLALRGGESGEPAP